MAIEDAICCDEYRLAQGRVRDMIWKLHEVVADSLLLVCKVARWPDTKKALKPPCDMEHMAKYREIISDPSLCTP